jgi:hypothetical protein
MDASRRGYAAGGSAVKTLEADHSTTIVLEHGEWKFHYNYFGGEPYGGREVVFLGGQPVWMPSITDRSMTKTSTQSIRSYSGPCARLRRTFLSAVPRPSPKANFHTGMPTRAT